MADQPLPGPYPLTLYRGDTRTWQLDFTEDDEVTTVDVSGRSWRAQIRESQASDAALIASMTIDSTDADDGLLVMRLTATEARKLTGSSGYWDLEGTLISDAEDVRTFLAGDVEVEGDGSRA